MTSHFDLMNWCNCQMAIKMMAGEIPPFCYSECIDPRQLEAE